MKWLDDFIDKINFKKMLKFYLVFSVLALLVSIGSTVYIFRDKITFALDYIKLSEGLKKSNIDNSIKPELDKLANDSDDVKDIIMLDKDNNIIYKAKSSDIGTNNKLILNSTEDNGRYLQEANNPDIFYKVVRPEKLIFSNESLKEWDEIGKEKDDELFYESNFSNKKVYLLNYLLDKHNGTKVFIITDIKTMPYGESFFEAIGVIIEIIFILYWIGLALWVYKDAKKKKMNEALWGIIAIITNLVGLVVYMLYRQNNEICYKCGTLQSKYNIFCSNCGTKIKKTCDSCGMIVDDNNKYCGKCGNDLKN
ncbi:zinc ribbon domain-containing protein [Clostridium sp.]|uniref:zinc ribbon domain-containing protein n=1 Tax=Clostridium sp. TaxID=1506 RepID=UPI00284C9933|nr:zinc ribbon domain-containing protein [Clostridium sp.]MDR3598802.1 zinc ribbon domain-containing protein [Clostridium sp.]